MEWNATRPPASPIESRSLGDSPGDLAGPQPPRRRRSAPSRRHASAATAATCPGSGHPVRVCETVDVRFLLEDMFAKIRRFGRADQPDRSGPSRPHHVPSVRTARVRQTKETVMTSTPSPAAVFLGLTAAAVGGAGLTACTGAAPAGQSGGGNRTGLEQPAALHLRGRRDDRPAQGAGQEVRRTGRDHHDRRQPARIRRGRSTRTSCGPSCSAARARTSGASGAARSAPPSPGRSRRSTWAPYYSKYGWDTMINPAADRGHDLRRREERGAVRLPRYRGLVQQGSVREGRRSARSRPATPSSRRPTTSWSRPTSPRWEPEASTAGTSCGSSSTCWRPRPGPSCTTSCWSARRRGTGPRWWRPSPTSRSGRTRSGSPKARSVWTRPTSSPPTCRARPPTPSPGRGPRRRPSSRRRRTRPTSTTSSCRPIRPRPATPASSRAT